jgi:tetratricopeptide (TPR) repeat protein
VSGPGSSVFPALPRRRSKRLGTVLLILIASSTLTAQNRSGRASSPSFDVLARTAAEAREAGRLDDAVAAYRRAVRLRPAWDEGWWYLATALYEQQQDATARDAFTRFLALKPDTGRAFALRGLCEFRLREYDRALADLRKAQTLGIGGNLELTRSAWYHTAILLLRNGQFELAVEPLTMLARSEPESASLADAIGLLLLRRAFLPADIPPGSRDVVAAAGRAGYSWFGRAGAQADTRFRALVDRYPDAPNVHYAYGAFLLQSDSDKALLEFRREIAVNPQSPYPHLEIAFELLRRGDARAAGASAREAVRLEPDSPAARNALGRALVELGDLQAAIEELQTAVKLAPESPEMHFALANAYARAGRKQDAARERAIFTKLRK